MAGTRSSGGYAGPTGARKVGVGRDAAGRKSDVLRAAILVDAPLPWAKTPPCK